MEFRTELDNFIKKEKRENRNKLEQKNSKRPVVMEEDIAKVVEAWTGIPVQKISQAESATLVQMEDNLRARIVGQKQAVSSVTTAIKRARVGLKNPNRPIASFLFSGPTGVGKTELVKALAECFYMSKEALIRLDMSEYMERHTVSKLIGSPPGYIGYSEGGQLTEAVRRKPYSIVLFDEVEKAHPSVFNLLLQVLEDGRLTDSKGRTTDFKNTIIVLTSNIGAQMLDVEKPKSKVGFNIKTPEKNSLAPVMNASTLEDNDNFDLQEVEIIDPEEAKEELERYTSMKGIVNKELKKFFRPEFINRLDEIIVFDHLTTSDLQKISVLLLKELNKRMEGRFTLKVSRAARDILITSDYNRLFGARPLRRAFMQLLESKLATSLLEGSLKLKSVVLVQKDKNNELKLTIEKSTTEENNSNSEVNEINKKRELITKN